VVNQIQNSSNKTSKSSGATSMEELMKKAQSSFQSLHKSQLIEGKITKLTSAEILVDINAKTEALVLEKDKDLLRQILSSLKVGDTVTVSVLNPESDLGYPVVSLRRFLDNILWEKLETLQKEQKPVQALVENITRGGYLIISNGISGFLPNSQAKSVENPQDLIGRRIEVFVLEFNRQARKIIFSQRPILKEEDFVKTIKNFKIGQKINAVISAVTSFGIFVSLENGIEGLIHISEISWEKVENLEDLFKVGENIEAKVIGFDKKAKRVELSIRQLSIDPFEKLSEQFKTDQKIDVKVSGIKSFGVSLEISEGIEGFIRKEKIPPTVKYEIGQEITATVSGIDKRRRRIILVPVLKEKPIGYR